jgi:hypothetical protein
MKYERFCGKLARHETTPFAWQKLTSGTGRKILIAFFVRGLGHPITHNFFGYEKSMTYATPFLGLIHQQARKINGLRQGKRNP